MSVELKRSNNYDKNHDKADGTKHHCVVCGKTIENPEWWIHIFFGWTVVTEPEAEQLIAEGHEAGDMSFFPIGNECLRKHPELKPYAETYIAPTLDMDAPAPEPGETEDDEPPFVPESDPERIARLNAKLQERAYDE